MERSRQPIRLRVHEDGYVVNLPQHHDECAHERQPGRPMCGGFLSTDTGKFGSPKALKRRVGVLWYDESLGDDSS